MRMKNIITLILLTCLIAQCNSTKAQTNVYHPFPDSNAVWGMNGGCFDTNCGDYSYIKFYYDGDTIIDGIEYKKIVKEVLPMTSGDCCIFPTGLLTGFLRQDIAAKKVYWRDQLMETDTLWYDFSVDVGDTLNSFLNYPDPWYEPKTVLSIDSVWVDTSYRKRINIDTAVFRSENTYSIIEGVGGTHGFRGLVDPNAWAIGTTLTCFSENGNVIYTPQTGADTIPCGDLPVPVQELHQPKGDLVSIYPNPTSGKITLNCEEYVLPIRIAIYDMIGRKHLKTEIDQAFTGIDISDLSPGIYYLTVETKKTIFTAKKIVKQ
jgi:hypothetical protein